MVVIKLNSFKGIRWIPWHKTLMKDVAVCDKPRGADKQALNRGFPNGETHLSKTDILN